MSDLISAAASALAEAYIADVSAASVAAENNAAGNVAEINDSCDVSSTKGKILSFILTKDKGTRFSAGEILAGAKLENGEGSPVIRQLYASGVLVQECKRGKYYVPAEVLILKTEDGVAYEWAGNKPINGASCSSGTAKKAKKALTASEIFEEFREKLSADFQAALKTELDSLEKGIKAEEEKAAAAAEEAAIEAEIKKLEEEAAERRRRLEALRGKVKKA